MIKLQVCHALAKIREMVEILEMTKSEQKPALLDELLILPPLIF